MNPDYDPKYIEALFDGMSASYERVNYITSFGFSALWRKQLVAGVDVKEDTVVVDLMTGMGECWKPLLRKSAGPASIIALDFSAEMLKRATARKAQLGEERIRILKENVFQNSIATGSADSVISGFGMKTFDTEQLHQLAQEIHRILKPGGQLSLMDVSVPSNPGLRFLYMFYLKRIIPWLGWLFLGNPEAYRMLGVYTEKFQNARDVVGIFRQHGFEVEYVEYFFGCASGIIGRRRRAVEE